MNSLDCVVAGGGPAGAATALALARAGASVALLERTRYDTPRFGETLPAASTNVLIELGVWDRFLADGHERSPGSVSYWGSSVGRTRSSITNPFGDGWHLDRRRFDTMLVRAAADAGASVRNGVGVTSCLRRGGVWRVTTTEGGDLHAAHVVDATGRAAVLARQVGAHRIAIDELVSMAVVGECGPHTDPRTVIEARPNGYWYSAVLPGGRIVIAYFTDRDLLPSSPEVRTMTWNQWLSEADVTGERAARVAGVAPRVLSAATCHLDAMAAEGWLAAGDAAFALDPLSSIGITNAIRAALRTASVVLGEVPREAYIDWCHAQLASYVSLRTHFYGLERRWPDSPFWSRRMSSNSGPAEDTAA